MAMKRLLAGILLALSGALASPVEAWDDQGHMMVAEVCYQRLTPAVRQLANALLKLNPMYSQWLTQIGDSVAPADRDARVFMLAATWPDAIKHDQGYISDGPQHGNRPGGAEATQNLGYKDLLMHKYWHYCDRPYSQDNSPLPPMAQPNAMTQVEAFRKVISSDAPDDLKSYDLVWLMHMVGDIHQPLHCVTRISKTDPDGDNGGNSVKIDDQTNVLHAFWDTVLGEEHSPAKIPKIVRHLSRAKKDLVADDNVKDWVDESYNVAIQKVYVKPIGLGDGPYRLSSKYRHQAAEVSRERIELAGERLANMLNAELK